MTFRSLALLLLLGLVAGGCARSTMPEHASLTLSNHSLLTVCDVYLWRSEVGWGHDYVDDRAPMRPGEARTFEVEEGRYNLQLDDCRRRTVYGRSGLRIRRNLQLEFRPIEVERDGQSHRRYADRPPNRL